MYSPYNNPRERNIRPPNREDPNLKKLQQILTPDKAKKPLTWLKTMFLIAP